MPEETANLEPAPGPPEFGKEQWVSLGNRYGSKTKKLSQVWAIVEEDGTLGEEVWYQGKGIHPGPGIGGVYEITHSNEAHTSVYVFPGKLGPRYLQRWENQNDILRWQLEDRNAKVMDRDERKRKEDMGHDEITEVLKPIRSAMTKTDYTGRQRILGIVIEALTRGR